MSAKVVFVGRQTELETLDAEWDRACAGEFRCVLLVGDAGVGKSRLAEEALRRHRGSCLELTARARPLSATASFDLWCQALQLAQLIVDALAFRDQRLVLAALNDHSLVHNKDAVRVSANTSGCQ